MQRPHKRDAYRSLLKPAAVPVMSTIWMTYKTEREQERKRESARERERERERGTQRVRERERREREEERELIRNYSTTGKRGRAGLRLDVCQV